MALLECPNCSAILPNRGVFCKECGKQSKCKRCSELLETDAKACVMCGQTIAQEVQDPAITAPNVQNHSLAINTIEYSETGRSRFVKTAFTNEVGQGMTEALALIIAGKISKPKAPSVNSQLNIPGLNDQLASTSLEDIEETDFSVVETVNIAKNEVQTVKSHLDSDRIKYIFSFDDEIALIDHRLKADSMLDFAKRLTTLYIYAHKIMNLGGVPRPKLTELYIKAGINTGGVRGWLAKAQDFLKKGEILTLSMPGEEKAKTFLDDFFDDSKTNKWTLGTASRKYKKSKTNKSEDTE